MRGVDDFIHSLGISVGDMMACAVLFGFGSSGRRPLLGEEGSIATDKMLPQGN